MQKAFVFVVCGSSEHLNMLKESYEWLLVRTALPIYVVTDSSRNEWPILYPNLVDVTVNSLLNNHQAAIWLKTSLNKILPANFLFTYLDSDILAWNDRVDEIFNYYVPPVTFAPDHCKLRQFSSYAVNCGCLEFFTEIRNNVLDEIAKQDQLALSTDPFILHKRRELLDLLTVRKQTWRDKWLFYTKYFLSWPRFQVGDFYFDKRYRCWKDASGGIIMHQVSMAKVAHHLGLRWSIIKQELQLPDKRPVFTDSCTHLHHLIDKKFNVKINHTDWQHWNGGVFVFHTGDNQFMQTWNELTVQIFDDPEWKTRDQGTLVATVWKLGLQLHPMLSSEWNLIVDYFTSGIILSDDGVFIIKGKVICPRLIHVYHHFGDSGWNIWNKILTFKQTQ